MSTNGSVFIQSQGLSDDFGGHRLQWCELTSKQRELCRCYLEGGWKTYRELAEKADVSEGMVYTFLHRPDVVCLLEEKNRDIDAESFDVSLRLREMTKESLNFLQGVVNNENAPLDLRVKVAQDILDRTIGKVARVKVSDGINDGRRFTAEEIRKIGQDAKVLLAAQAVAGVGSSLVSMGSEVIDAERTDAECTDCSHNEGIDTNS